MLLLFLAVYMLNYSVTAWIVTVAWIGGGLLTYKGYAARREVLHVQKIKTLERIERKDYRIMVCLASPRTMTSLADMALAVAKKHEAEITFLHLVEVREGQKLRSGLEEAELGRQSISQLEVLAPKRSKVPARTVIKVTHRISRGIIDMCGRGELQFHRHGPAETSRVSGPGLFFPHRHGASESARGSRSLAWNYRYGPCPHDPNPLRGKHPHASRNGSRPGPCRLFPCKPKVALVFERGTSKTQQDEKAKQVSEIMRESSLPASLVVIRERDVLRGLVKASREADLVLMGGRSGDFLDLLFANSLTQEITRQVACPVLWVKEYEERKSFWSEMLRSPGKGERNNGE